MWYEDTGGALSHGKKPFVAKNALAGWANDIAGEKKRWGGLCMYVPHKNPVPAVSYLLFNYLLSNNGNAVKGGGHLTALEFIQ